MGIFHQDEYYFKRWHQSGKDACEKLLGRDFSFAEFYDFAFALMGVRKDLNSELAIYAANDTLTSHTVSYTVEEYDQALNKKIIAMGICKQEKNSVDLIQRITDDGTPKLWIIKWNENGKEYQNHVITRTASYDVMRKWVAVIGREEGFLDEILELKLLKNNSSF